MFLRLRPKISRVVRRPNILYFRAPKGAYPPGGTPISLQRGEQGNPVGLSHTVMSDKSVEENGGPNPVSGYSMIAEDSLEDATEKAKGCPILESGGSIEVAEIINMM